MLFGVNLPPAPVIPAKGRTMDRLTSDRMFATVMELGSFVAAAEKLGTSSGQASKLVSGLEAELGVRLLNRTTRAVSPTEAGQSYYDRLRPLLDEFADLDLAVRNIAQVPRGRLRVTAPDRFGAAELATALSDFAIQYPDIELDVEFTDRLVNLVDEGFDVAVRAGPPRDSSLIARKLYQIRVGVFASPAYLAAHGTPETPQDLTAHHCILDTNMRDPTRWHFLDSEGQDYTVQVSGRIRYSNAEACFRAVEAGLGIAFVPSFAVTCALHSNDALRILTDYPTPDLGVFAVYPHNRHLAAKVRVLVDFLVRRYRNAPDWEAGW